MWGGWEVGESGCFPHLLVVDDALCVTYYWDSVSVSFVGLGADEAVFLLQFVNGSEWFEEVAELVWLYGTYDSQHVTVVVGAHTGLDFAFVVRDAFKLYGDVWVGFVEALGVFVEGSVFYEVGAPGEYFEFYVFFCPSAL